MKHLQVAGIFLLAAALAGPRCARAQTGGQAGDLTQDGADAPAMAMGSGRMVRGTVTGLSPNKIMVKTETGESYEIALSPNTRLMKERQPIRPGDVKVGDGLGAGGELDASTQTLHALFVSVIDAEQVKKLRGSLGKTWIQGKITAIDELKLTILRGDKVTQVIAVDEDTSFRRGGRNLAMMMQGDGGAPTPGRAGSPEAGGESITLADLKVGDLIAGQGALKAGVFVPATLAVMDPAQRRRRQGEAAPGTPPGPK